MLFRRDLFPPKVCFHLSKLQRHAQTHAWEFTEKALNEAFGPIFTSCVLPEINSEPIGSGCCAQVYVGMLDIRMLSLAMRKRLEHRFRESVASGRAYGTRMLVAIKVLHPDIALNFSRDLNVLKSVVSFVARLFPSLEWLSLKESIDEFAALMEVQVWVSVIFIQVVRIVLDYELTDKGGLLSCKH